MEGADERPGLVALDVEGVLLPEIWIAVAERTGIDELRRTTRDEPDYDGVMRGRLALLDRHGLTFADGAAGTRGNRGRRRTHEAMAVGPRRLSPRARRIDRHCLGTSVAVGPDRRQRPQVVVAAGADARESSNAA